MAAAKKKAVKKKATKKAVKKKAVKKAKQEPKPKEKKTTRKSSAAVLVEIARKAKKEKAANELESKQQAAQRRRQPDGRIAVPTKAKDMVLLAPDRYGMKEHYTIPSKLVPGELDRVGRTKDGTWWVWYFHSTVGWETLSNLEVKEVLEKYRTGFVKKKIVNPDDADDAVPVSKARAKTRRVPLQGVIVDMFASEDTPTPLKDVCDRIEKAKLWQDKEGGFRPSEKQVSICVQVECRTARRAGKKPRVTIARDKSDKIRKLVGTTT